MITCNLKGGLGNQLFQIFATIVYSMKRKDKIVFRNVEQLLIGNCRPTYWNSFLESLKILTKDNINISNYYLLQYNEQQYKDIFKEQTPENVILDGYFQSYKYFIEYEKSLFSMIRLQQQQESIKKEYYYILNDKTPIISMHFRLGDYKNLQDCHNILKENYYINSLIEIKKQIDPSSIKILFFCEKEDNQIIYSYIRRISFETKIDMSKFIKVPDEIPDYKQMLIMSVCDHNIIANSTFSWWGAYFNRNPEKIVCYPSKWFGPKLHHFDTSDLFLDDWIRVID